MIRVCTQKQIGRKQACKHTHTNGHLSVCTSEHLTCPGCLPTGSKQLLLSIQCSKPLNVCNTTHNLPPYISRIAHTFKLDIYHKLLDRSPKDEDILPVGFFTLKKPQEFEIPDQLSWAQLTLSPWYPLFLMILMYV